MWRHGCKIHTSAKSSGTATLNSSQVPGRSDCGHRSQVMGELAMLYSFRTEPGRSVLSAVFEDRDSPSGPWQKGSVDPITCSGQDVVFDCGVRDINPDIRGLLWVLELESWSQAHSPSTLDAHTAGSSQVEFDSIARSAARTERGLRVWYQRPSLEKRPL